MLLMAGSRPSPSALIGGRAYRRVFLRGCPNGGLVHDAPRAGEIGGAPAQLALLADRRVRNVLLALVASRGC